MSAPCSARDAHNRRRGRSRDWLAVDLRFAIYARDAFLCVWCGAAAESLDHYVPREDGGTHEPSNVLAACLACNSARQDLDEGAWIRKLRARGICTGGLLLRVRAQLAAPIDRALGKRLAEEKHGTNSPRLFWSAAWKAKNKAPRAAREVAA